MQSTNLPLQLLLPQRASSVELNIASDEEQVFLPQKCSASPSVQRRQTRRSPNSKERTKSKDRSGSRTRARLPSCDSYSPSMCKSVYAASTTFSMSGTMAQSFSGCSTGTSTPTSAFPPHHQSFHCQQLSRTRSWSEASDTTESSLSPHLQRLGLHEWDTDDDSHLGYEDGNCTPRKLARSGSQTSVHSTQSASSFSLRTAPSKHALPPTRMQASICDTDDDDSLFDLDEADLLDIHHWSDLDVVSATQCTPRTQDLTQEALDAVFLGCWSPVTAADCPEDSDEFCAPHAQGHAQWVPANAEDTTQCNSLRTSCEDRDESLIARAINCAALQRALDCAASQTLPASGDFGDCLLLPDLLDDDLDSLVAFSMEGDSQTGDEQSDLASPAQTSNDAPMALTRENLAALARAALLGPLSPSAASAGPPQPPLDTPLLMSTSSLTAAVATAGVHCTGPRCAPLHSLQLSGLPPLHASVVLHPNASQTLGMSDVDEDDDDELFEYLR